MPASRTCPPLFRRLPPLLLLLSRKHAYCPPTSNGAPDCCGQHKWTLKRLLMVSCKFEVLGAPRFSDSAETLRPIRIYYAPCPILDLSVAATYSEIDLHKSVTCVLARERPMGSHTCASIPSPHPEGRKEENARYGPDQVQTPELRVGDCRSSVTPFFPLISQAGTTFWLYVGVPLYHHYSH